ncbi:MAG TPA: hypothetical protein VGY77_04560 [Gemmataceae bacterium]|nr:hypothetical protein [Gemmataceae bacterium]
MYYFCTYFDRRYLPRGLALHRSLMAHCRSFQLWVLCLDEKTFGALTQLNLPGILPINLVDFEKGNAELLRAKQNRSPIEYYFTCTPFLPLFVLKNHPEVEVVTYLDADLFFFADPAPLYAKLNGQSIAITAHRFSKQLPGWDRYGIYNVGWLSFRRDSHGLECLSWWQKRCLEWCFDRVENGRFADQKYLDDWPTRFSGVVVLEHKGANLAPWNFADAQIREVGGRVWVDEDPLVFFHFHNLRQISERVYNPNIADYRVKPSRTLVREVYGPYLRTLFATHRDSTPLLKEAVPVTSLRYGQDDRSATKPVSVPRRVFGKADHFFRVSREILNRNYIVLWGNCVF